MGSESSHGHPASDSFVYARTEADGVAEFKADVAADPEFTRLTGTDECQGAELHFDDAPIERWLAFVARKPVGFLQSFLRK